MWTPSILLRRKWCALLLAASFGALGGEYASAARDGLPIIRYVGSSTVGLFIRDAEPLYGRVRFNLDTTPESLGGEQAILGGTADLAGSARVPSQEIGRKGITATPIGRDGIAVIVNRRVPVDDLSMSDLRAIFTGRMENWKELGGPDLPIRPLIVGSESATREVFRAAVLAGSDYANCRVIEPDGAMPSAVASTDGAIGQISFAFLGSVSGIRAVSVAGQEPVTSNFEYPIARPLYLLWRKENEEAERFAVWSRSREGQRVLMQRFVGYKVLGSFRSEEPRIQEGTLVVETETEPVLDGGIYYFPHLPYEILTRHGELLRRVRNHLSQNDEDPSKVLLPPGTYLIRAERRNGSPIDFFVTVEAGLTTRIDVEDLASGERQ